MLVVSGWLAISRIISLFRIKQHEWSRLISPCRRRRLNLRENLVYSPK